MFSTALIIVWREGVEALLIVGILYAWLRRHPAPRATAYLGAGIAAGLCCAVALAVLLFQATELFADSGQDYLQIGMMMLAGLLIVQMVTWMRSHGAHIQPTLQAREGASPTLWGIFILTALAIAREGSEVVVFLYGVGSASGGSSLNQLVAGASAGLLFAGVTFALLQLASQTMSWRLFFRLSEAMLLLLAGALLINAIDRMVSIDLLPALKDQMWDTSGLLEDDALGGLPINLLGYRSRPNLTVGLAFCLYWASVLCLLRITRPRPARLPVRPGTA